MASMPFHGRLLLWTHKPKHASLCPLPLVMVFYYSNWQVPNTKSTYLIQHNQYSTYLKGLWLTSKFIRKILQTFLIWSRGTDYTKLAEEDNVQQQWKSRDFCLCFPETQHCLHLTFGTTLLHIKTNEWQVSFIAIVIAKWPDAAVVSSNYFKPITQLPKHRFAPKEKTIAYVS